ncbi:hypothetical protein TNIN_151401 [Trichonephila inaurata madagascariensis]|uniref:Uncharacterized protein n=1 Tax=Trichonephila inaurata madagascariensis TaxID=2747483 RepID=A0A8X6XXX9_9ARAC|nr:hypothetical protein TNIN_151401 [Trichonephila inaurata madagascariensis]
MERDLRKQRRRNPSSVQVQKQRSCRGHLSGCIKFVRRNIPGVSYGKIRHMGLILLLGGACKDLLLAPGNRSNDTHDNWQRAHHIHEGSGNGRGRPDRKSPHQGRKESGSEKNEKKTWSEEGRRLDDGL